MDPLLAVAERLRKAKSALAFTGAGVSAESGIPTFRGEGGLWEAYPPSRFGHLPGLAFEWLIQPKKVARFLVEVLEAFFQAEPNPAHIALAELERRGFLQGVITQNIDDLHERAGTKRLIKLHGSLDRIRCLRCGQKEKVPRERFKGWAESFKRMKVGRKSLLEQLGKILPRCPNCGSFRRPDVVFFGEGLPEEEWLQAVEGARSADLILVIGTSGEVYPAAELPWIAKRSGATVAVIDEAKASWPSADLSIIGKAGPTLAALLRAVICNGQDARPPRT